MLARKFFMCTDDVKVSLFKAYCTPLYTAHLWCNFSKARMRKLQVAYNDAFRILLKLPRWTSASFMFVNSNVPTFHAVLRNFMFKFMCRLADSKNRIIMTLTVTTLSDTRYSSCLWRHWKECLYVFQFIVCILVCLFFCLLDLSSLWFCVFLSFLYGSEIKVESRKKKIKSLSKAKKSIKIWNYRNPKVRL